MATEAVDSRRLLFPGLAGLYRGLAPLGWPLVRIVSGAIMIPHSFPKLFGNFAPVLAAKVLAPLGLPVPLFWAYFLGVLELVGGILLVAGGLTRLVALAFAVETAVIFLFVALPKGWSGAGGGEFTALLTVLFIAIFCHGPGGFSLDRAMAKEI